MTVASNQLGASGTVGVGTTTLYTCPTGKRTIVKTLTMQNTNAAAQRLVWQVKNGATTKWQWSYHLAAVNAAGEYVEANTWFVLVAGDVLSCVVAAASVELSVHGSELVL